MAVGVKGLPPPDDRSPLRRGFRGRWTVGRLVRRSLLVALLIGLALEYGKARSYTPGFWSQVGFMIRDVGGGIGNSFEAAYRLVFRGENPATTFREKAWPQYLLVCMPVDANAAPTKERQTARELHAARYLSLLHDQIFQASGATFTDIKQRINENQHPVVFLPLPERNAFEIRGFSKGTDQSCRGGDNPAVEHSRIPVRHFNFAS